MLVRGLRRNDHPRWGSEGRPPAVFGPDSGRFTAPGYSTRIEPAQGSVDGGRYLVVPVPDPDTVRSPSAAPTRPVTRSIGRRLVGTLTVGAVSMGTLIVAPVEFASTGARVARAEWAPARPTLGSTARMPVFGDKGSQVKALQQALIARGVTVPGGADGVFGNGTRTAVQTFQTTRGITPTGVVDATTAHLLGLAPAPPLPLRGQRGAAVRALQNALIAAGVTVTGGVDGIFGAGTAAAVAAFQTGRGLSATGIVDIDTAIALGIVPGTTPPTGSPTTSIPAPTTPVTTVPVTTLPATTVPMTTVPGTPSTWPVRGQSGEAVRTLQNALIVAGIAVTGGADGVFGGATERAIAQYQRNVQLRATGAIDLWTARLLGLTASPVWPVLGQRSDDVRALQNALIAAGTAVRGGADGVFGNATATAVRAFQQRRGLATTGAIDLHTAALLGLNDPSGSATGTTTAPAPTAPTTTAPVSSAPTTTIAVPPATMTVFPVQGPCWFTDTWMAPRSGGRRHEGVDIIAKTGNLLYAVTDGTITRQFFDRPGSLGGNALRLTAADGTYFHYAHLSAFADGIAVGSTVVAGQLIGYVGSTGSSSTPHLHFEYHPGGGVAVNPFPAVKAINACRVTTPLPQPAPITTSTSTTIAGAATPPPT